MFRLGSLVGLTVAAFVYGLAVGHYRWPPFQSIDRLVHVVRPDFLTRRYLDRPYYDAKVALFRLSPGHADVVMLGDSLTEQGNWSEILGGLSVLNRGISSDNSGGVLARLDEVIARKPKVVCLLIGTNDLQAGDTAADVIGNISQIVRDLQAAGIEPILETVPFVVRDYQPNVNAGVVVINAFLRETARASGLSLVDLNTMTAKNGSLDETLSYDGIHLGADVYLRWAAALAPLLRREVGVHGG